MTVRINKQSINLREKLSELDKPSGLTGEELLRSGTSSEARDALDLEEHLFEEFESTGIDDNATSTVVTVSDSGVDVTGTVTADGLTVDSDAQVGSLIAAGVSTNLDIGGVISRAYPAARLESYRTSGNFSTTLGIKTLNTTGDLVSRVLVGDNGDVSFYEDTGTTAKMVWDASAESLKIGDIGGAAEGALALKSNANGYAIAIEENSGTERWTMGVNVDGDLGFFNSTDTIPSVLLDDAGNLGIGTSSPNYKLEVNHSGDDKFAIVTNDEGDVSSETGIYLRTSSKSVVGTGTSAVLAFEQGSSERMRLDNSGNLLVGTTASPTTQLSSGNIVGQIFSSSSHSVLDVSSTFVNSGFSIGNTRASYLVTISGGAPNNGSAIATYIFTKAAYDAELVQLGNTAGHFHNVFIEAQLSSSSAVTVNLQVRFTGSNLTGTGTITTNAIRIG